MIVIDENATGREWKIKENLKVIAEQYLREFFNGKLLESSVQEVLEIVKFLIVDENILLKDADKLYIIDPDTECLEEIDSSRLKPVAKGTYKYVPDIIEKYFQEIINLDSPLYGIIKENVMIWKNEIFSRKTNYQERMITILKEYFSASVSEKIVGILNEKIFKNVISFKYEKRFIIPKKSWENGEVTTQEDVKEIVSEFLGGFNNFLEIISKRLTEVLNFGVEIKTEFDAELIWKSDERFYLETRVPIFLNGSRGRSRIIDCGKPIQEINWYAIEGGLKEVELNQSVESYSIYEKKDTETLIFGKRSRICYFETSEEALISVFGTLENASAFLKENEILEYAIFKDNKYCFRGLSNRYYERNERNNAYIIIAKKEEVRY